MTDDLANFAEVRQLISCWLPWGGTFAEVKKTADAGTYPDAANNEIKLSK